jgi:hypothetical protein
VSLRESYREGETEQRRGGDWRVKGSCREKERRRPASWGCVELLILARFGSDWNCSDFKFFFFFFLENQRNMLISIFIKPPFY